MTSTYQARSEAATYRAPSGAQADAALSDWLRHYWIVLLLVTTLGAVGAGAAWWLATPRYEMWTIVSDSGSHLPDRQVGVVGQTLFQNQDTYAAAAAALTAAGEPVSENEVATTVQMRSVPDSRLMIVVARGNNAARTQSISGAMADAVSKAFETAGYPALTILGKPQRGQVESGGSLNLFVMLGAVAFFLLSLGISVAHYRFRRPVLEFGAMMTLLAPTTVVAVSARRRWLGALRHFAPVGLSDAVTKDVARRLDAADSIGSMQWPGASRRRQARLMKLVGVSLDPAATKILLVTEPCSRSRDLSEAALIDPVGTTTVLWLT